MTDKELFLRSFSKADELEMAKYLVKDSFSHVFSVGFEKKMNRLISKHNRISLRTRRKISKSLLAAVIALIVLFAGLMSVSASRQKIVEFIESISKRETTIVLKDFEADAPETIETEYTLGTIPDGFTINQYDKEDVSVFIVWTNQKGESIVFSQDVVYGAFIMDNEHDYEKFEMYGYPAYIYGDETGYAISWSDGSYHFSIVAPKDYKDDLINMAKNIKQKTNKL